MQKVTDFLKLMRVRHYIKNLLVFVPLFFSKELFQLPKLHNGVLGFICFCLTSSTVYVLNDLLDIDKDRQHPTKKNRPLASGRVTSKEAFCLITFCLLSDIIISFILGDLNSFFLLILYLGLNAAYSIRLKDYPIIDIVILASGFVIRVFYGGLVTNVAISGWLYLVVVSASLYMGLGKRRNELKRSAGSRSVLKYYSDSFLEKNMYVCVSLANVFYALWTMDFEEDTRLIWTVPIFILILMRYSYDIEGDSDGDPVEVILQDKILIGVVLLYAICLFILLYFG